MVQVYPGRTKSNILRHLMLWLSVWHVSSITLFDKSKSYAIFDVWNITTVGKLELNFKTQSQYCLVLYVDDQQYLQSGDPTKFKTTGNYLEVSLIRGKLQVTQQINSELTDKKQITKKTINIGSHLNDLAWHKLKLTKFVGTLQVEIDNQLKLITFSKNLANEFHINSRLFIGGLSQSKVDTSYGAAKFKPRFVGCIEDLKYSSGTMLLSRVYRFMKGERLAPTCLNTCSINPCQNGGQCINLFTRAGCDCFGSGYDGNRCTTPSETVHLTANDYIRWSTQDSFSKTQSSLLRFRFKSARSDGLIFYTKRTGNILLVELNDGHLRIAAGPETEVPRDIILPKVVFDGEWHSVIVNKKDRIVSVMIDNGIPKNLTINTVNVDNEKNEPVYFGGLKLPKFTFGVKATQGFVGCLQQVHYNKIDIIYKVQNTINRRIQIFGKITRGCGYNKTNIPLPTKKSNIKTPIKEKTEIISKTNIIKEIHTRESGIGQGVIVWITAAIVIGTIIIMISAACVVHHVRIRHNHSHRKKSSSTLGEDEGEDKTELTRTHKTSETNTDYSSPELTPTMKNPRHDDNRKKSSKKKTESNVKESDDNQSRKSDAEEKLIAKKADIGV